MHSIYSDGGCLGKNPSPHGGTWAWCLVHEDQRVQHGSGLVFPADVGVASVSCNLTELLAAVLALEAMPDRWSGMLWTDSEVTLKRLRKPRQTRFRNIPMALVCRVVAAVERCLDLQVKLVAGHPNRQELSEGLSKKKVPVSVHNVWVDKECTRLASEWKQRSPLHG